MERRTFIKTLLLSSGALIFGPQNLISAALDSKTLRLVMIYNNISHSDRLGSEWGLSVWIENKDSALLFDTGGDPSLLWKNVETTGIAIEKLSKIVISHFHWDHLNGLPIVLEKTDYQPEVFVPDYNYDFILNYNPKGRIIGVKEPIRIDDAFWSTGQLKAKLVFGFIYEQSLIISLEEVIYILTGCAHPGIVEVAKTAKAIHPEKTIELVMGGYHMRNRLAEDVKPISTQLKNLQVKRLAPSHCTGDQAMEVFKSEWGERFIDFSLGKSLKV